MMAIFIVTKMALRFFGTNGTTLFPSPIQAFMQKICQIASPFADDVISIVKLDLNIAIFTKLMC